MKKPLSAFLLLTIPTLVFCQRPTSGKIIPESVLQLNRGIYMNMEEFLTNNPSIPYYFEVVNSLADYYVHPEERNDYILSYRDDMGYRKVLRAREIWGFCDGSDIFVSFQGKPYKLVHLGAISVLRYQQEYHRTAIAQVLSLYAFGQTVTYMERTQDLLFDMKNDQVIVPTSRNIRKLIAYDALLYADYQNDRKTDYFEKNLLYLQKYNNKYPIIITASGITLSAEPIKELVDKK